MMNPKSKFLISASTAILAIAVAPSRADAQSEQIAGGCYAYSDQFFDWSIGFRAGISGPRDLMIIQGFQAPLGGDSIDQLLVAEAGPAASMDLTWCVYQGSINPQAPIKRPFRNPSSADDAQLLWSQRRVGGERLGGNYLGVNVPNVPVEGVFFVAVIYHDVVPGTFPGPLARDFPGANLAWESGSFGDIDPADVDGTSDYLGSLAINSNFGQDYTFVLEASGSGCDYADAYYRIDSGVANDALGFSCNGTSSPTTDFAALTAFDTSYGSDIITYLEVDFGSDVTALPPLQGSFDVEWCIWQDPDNDSIPDDAFLQWSSAGTVSFSGLGSGQQRRRVTVPNILVSGTFFAGIIVRNEPAGSAERLLGIDTHRSSGGRCWFLHNSAGFCGAPIDPQAISSTSARVRTDSPFLSQVATSEPFIDATWLIRAGSERLAAVTPQPGCAALPNVVSPDGAKLQIFGATSIRGNSFFYDLRDAPPNTFGMLLLGEGSGVQPLGNGQLCLNGAMIFRQPVFPIDSLGRAFNGRALSPPANVFPTLVAGDTYNAQAWFRSPVGAGSNLSNSMALTFTF